jgi:DNA repair protein RadC
MRHGSETTGLYVRDGSAFREAAAREVVLQAQALINERFRAACVLKNPTLVRAFFKLQLGGREHEVFAVVFLDGQRRVIDYLEIFRGTINNAQVYVREVVKEALKHNAAAVILAHNHPSGRSIPSDADKATTSRLRVMLELVDVEVLDHIIVGKSITSFVELGLLK